MSLYEYTVILKSLHLCNVFTLYSRGGMEIVCNNQSGTLFPFQSYQKFHTGYLPGGERGSCEMLPCMPCVPTFLGQSADVHSQNILKVKECCSIISVAWWLYHEILERIFPLVISLVTQHKIPHPYIFCGMPSSPVLVHIYSPCSLIQAVPFLHPSAF